MRKLLAITTLSLALAACSEAAQIQIGPSVTGLQAGSLAVSLVADGFDVMNQTERPVFLAVFEREYSNLVDLYPCSSESPGCRSLAPGAHRQFAWTAISGYGPTRSEYVLYWWHAESGADGQLRAGGLTTVGIKK